MYLHYYKLRQIKKQHYKPTPNVVYVLGYDSKLTLSPHDLITVQLSQKM